MKIVKTSSKQLKNSIVEQTAGSLTKLVPPSKLGVPFSKILKETKKIFSFDKDFQKMKKK